MGLARRDRLHGVASRWRRSLVAGHWVSLPGLQHGRHAADREPRARQATHPVERWQGGCAWALHRGKHGHPRGRYGRCAVSTRPRLVAAPSRRGICDIQRAVLESRRFELLFLLLLIWLELGV